MSGKSRHSFEDVARTLTVAGLLALFDIEETWRPVEGWPYEVSSWGRVRRIGGRILQPGITNGYQHVSLSRDGVVESARIHRLVAIAFVGPPPFEGAEVAHNDGDALNCRPKNLRWASAVENQADRRRHGTHIEGEDVHCAKLTAADIPAIRRRIADGHRYQDIADDYGVDKSCIGYIAVNRTWRHVPRQSEAA